MSKTETSRDSGTETEAETPSVEELIQRAANGDEDAVDLLSVDVDAIDDHGQPAASDNEDDQDADADVDRDARLCEFCETPLSSNSAWSYGGKNVRYAIRSFLCPDCRLDGRGSVTEVEIQTADARDDSLERIQAKLDSQQNPYGVAQSTRQPALGLGPGLPDGTYHFVRVDSFTVEFRAFVDVDADDLQAWVDAGRWDWTNNVDIVVNHNDQLDRPVVRFHDQHNGPGAADWSPDA